VVAKVGSDARERGEVVVQSSLRILMAVSLVGAGASKVSLRAMTRVRAVVALL